jgi:hypothetical protein
MIDVSSMSNIFQDEHAGKKAIEESFYHGYTMKFAISKPDNKFSSLYRFPKYGFGVYVGSFNNRNIGYPMAFFGWIEVPFRYYKQSHKFSFGYGGEFGLACNFNPYQRISNPTNVFLGSSGSYILGAYLYADYHVNKYVLIGISIGFRHFSNGAWKQPNIGVNIFSPTISLKGKIDNPLPVQHGDLQLPKYTQRWKWGGKLVFGRKQNGLAIPYYYKVLTGITLLKQISYKYSIGAGLETTFSIGKKDDLTLRTSWRDIVSPSVVGCWEWFISENFVVPIDIGVYLLPKNSINNEKYQTYARIGIRYYFTHKFWAGITVKGHSNVINTVADFSEIGIGYQN